MTYEDPRAYLLGLEGVALLRAFTGECDREFVEARIAGIRRVLADRALADAAAEVDRVDPVAGYHVWSATYDEPNSAFTCRRDERPGVNIATPTCPLSSAHLGRGHGPVCPSGDVWSGPPDFG